MKRIFLSVILLALFSSIAIADTPPSWNEFKMESSNGKYVAQVIIDSKPINKEPWKNKYRLTVSEKESKSVLWSCQYHYDGYPEGILSDDGEAFVYVNEWYKNDYPVVSIYYQGLKSHQIAGRQFQIDKKELIQTASHHLWLTQHREPRYGFLYDYQRLVCEIFTIDKKRYLIDVESGLIL